jgi:hypothetical protein
MRFFSEGEQKGKHMLAETHWMALMVHAIPFSLHESFFIRAEVTGRLIISCDLLRNNHDDLRCVCLGTIMKI